MNGRVRILLSGLLLESIIAGQTAEIERLRGWYRAWYVTEVPWGGPGHRW